MGAMLATHRDSVRRLPTSYLILGMGRGVSPMQYARLGRKKGLEVHPHGCAAGHSPIQGKSPRSRAGAVPAPS